MQKLIDLTQALFDILETHNLLNISHDDDPMNSFRFYAALYLIQKEVDTRKLNAFWKLLQNPEITNAKILAKNKEALLLTVLKECEANLVGLDKGHELYPENRKRIVLDAIEKLKRENIKLCKEFGATYSIPLTLNLFASLNLSLPSLRPDAGFLEDCADRALNEIKVGRTPITEESPPLILIEIEKENKKKKKEIQQKKETTASKKLSPCSEKKNKEKDLKEYEQECKNKKHSKKKEKEEAEDEETQMKRENECFLSS